MAAGILDQLLEFFQRLLADVMFDALDIAGHDLAIQTKQEKKLREDEMPPLNPFRDGPAFGGQHEPAIFFILEEAELAQALDHEGDAGAAELEGAGNVRDTGIALGLDQLMDALEVILAVRGKVRFVTHGRCEAMGPGADGQLNFG